MIEASLNQNVRIVRFNPITQQAPDIDRKAFDFLRRGIRDLAFKLQTEREIGENE
jgi:hypothetical protein